MTSLSVPILVILPLIFSSCCPNAKPRFWKVRDNIGGGLAYTVDTAAVPSSSLVPHDIRYVDARGGYVEVRNPKVLREMTEQEWRAATSGAGYSLLYCGHRNACWAKTKDR